MFVTIHVQKLKNSQRNKIVKQNFVKQVHWFFHSQNIIFDLQVNKDRTGGKLDSHSSEFNEKRIIQVIENIYVAIGYGLANCIMLVGDNGVVIIDTMESPEAAKEVLDEFRKITEKPIVGIVLTHFHADHTNGISVFVEDRFSDQDTMEIITHDTFPKFLSQVMNVRSQITYKRAVRQFGTEIPREAMKNAGIGLNLK